MRKAIVQGCLTLVLTGGSPLGLAGQEPALLPIEGVAGATVGSVTILGVGVLPGGLVPADLPIAAGAPYTVPALQLTERRIARAFAEDGYPFTVVEFATDLEGDPPIAHVRLRITPGPLATFGAPRVEIVRAPRDPAAVEALVQEAGVPLREADVLRWLPFAPGETVTASVLEHAAERLRAIPLVEGVTVGAQRSPLADDVLIPTFTVTTGRVQAVNLEGTVSSQRCVEGRLNWWNRHLFGGPRSVLLSVGGSNLFARQLRNFPCTGTGDGPFGNPDYFVQAELREPLRPQTWLSLGAEVSRLSAPQAYIRRGYQLRMGVNHELERGLFVGSSLAPERRENPAGAPLLCGVYGVCTGGPLSELLGTRTHLPLEVTVSWGEPPFEGVATPAADAPIWLVPVARPWRLGVRSSLIGAVEGVLSDYTYGGVSAEANVARVLTPRFELASRVRGGFIVDGGDPVPPQARLYGGGVLGVRGVRPNRLGPLVLTVPVEAVAELGCEPVPGGCEGITVRENAVRVRPTGGDALVELSLEARAWTFRWLQLAVFTDLGAVRSGAVAGAPASVTPSVAIITPGVGAMIVSPLGPVRVDLAYDPSPVRLYPLLTPGEDDMQIVLGTVRFDPFTFDAPGGGREFRRRLRFQLSMGQPF